MILIPPEVAHNAVARGVCKIGKVEEANVLLHDMLQMGLLPTIATFTTLIDKYCKSRLDWTRNEYNLMQSSRIC